MAQWFMRIETPDGKVQRHPLTAVSEREATAQFDAVFDSLDRISHFPRGTAAELVCQERAGRFR